MVSTSYSTAGTYTVTLTVTDDDGAADTDTAVVTVTEKPAQQKMRVGNITLSGDCITRGPWTWCESTAVVNIVDESNAPVAGATVEGTWSGAYSEDVTGTTGSEGNVTFETKYVKDGGTFTFTVNNVSNANWVYDSSANVETKDSITLP